jgi:hypothetical protein
MCLILCVIQFTCQELAHVTLKTSIVTEVPHTLSTFEKQMRFEVLAAVNTETTLFQPGRQVLAIQDSMTAVCTNLPLKC